MMRCAKGTAQIGLPTPQFLQLPRNVSYLSGSGLPALRSNASHISNGDRVTDSEGSDATSSQPSTEVRESPGKGFGLYAVDTIPAYSKVLEDDALLSLAQGEDLPQLWAKYRLLPPELKKSFDSLSLPPQLAAKEGMMMSKLEQRGYVTTEAEQMARVNSRWQANAFKTGAASVGSSDSQKWSYSLFGAVARINHSCTPNTSAHYRPSGSEVVYALRDIEAGEEILLGYFDITMPFSGRQERTKSWSFQCSCPACSPNGSLAGSDYEERLSYVHRHLASGDEHLDPRRMIESTLRAISIAASAEYTWLVVALPKLYLNLHNLESRLNRRGEKAREALAMGLEWEVKTTGPESPSSQQRRRNLIDFDTVR